jgi:23S rRNA U2552 (ribose-2'-O)-methylase RlmE/FtsJ
MVLSRRAGVTSKLGGKSDRGSRELKVRVRSHKGRSLASKLWLERQLNDPYVARAKREGLRSRAAFKLAEIDDRFHFLKPGARVVDLGAAPGGWSQIAAQRVGAVASEAGRLRSGQPPATPSPQSNSPQSKSAVADFDHSTNGPKPAYTRFPLGEGWGGGSGGRGTNETTGSTPTPDPSPQAGGEESTVRAQRKSMGGRVVAIDLLDMPAIPGVQFLQLDFLDASAPDRLKTLLNGPADVVLSDMAANATGHRKTDHLRIMALAEAAAMFAREILRPGGTFLCKVLQGGTEAELLAGLKRDFATVRHVKPAASRSDSAELYVLALGYRGPGQRSREELNGPNRI